VEAGLQSTLPNQLCRAFLERTPKRETAAVLESISSSGHLTGADIDNFSTAANGGWLTSHWIPEQHSKAAITFQDRVHHDPVAKFKNSVGVVVYREIKLPQVMEKRKFSNRNFGRDAIVPG
jgi:hypothetical protein